MISFRWLCGREFHPFSTHAWEKEKKGSEKPASVIKSVTKLLASKHSAFPLAEVSASEVPVIYKKLVSKEATSEATILKPS